MDNPPPSSDPEKSSDAEEVEEGAVERPKFKPTEKDELKQDRHMEADDRHQEVGTLVAEGKEFRDGRANAIALAKLIKSYAATVYEIALNAARSGDWVAEPDIDRFAFESAHVRFIAGGDESMRMDDPESSPAIEAARKVTELMQAHDDELVELAREVGPKGAEAYRKLLKAVGDSEDAKVSWASPGRAPVVVTSIGAAKAFQTLAREGERLSEEITVVGDLSMADADLNRFKLKLFKNGPKPPQLKRKRVVIGDFDDPVGESVKEQGLWNSPVEAQVRIERERAEDVATPRDPKFILLSVKPTTPPDPRKKRREPMPGSMQLADDVFGDSE